MDRVVSGGEGGGVVRKCVRGLRVVGVIEVKYERNMSLGLERRMFEYEF